MVEKYIFGTNHVLISRLSEEKGPQFSHSPNIKFHHAQFQDASVKSWTGVGWDAHSWPGVGLQSFSGDSEAHAEEYSLTNGAGGSQLQHTTALNECFWWKIVYLIQDKGNIHSIRPSYQWIKESRVCILGPWRPKYRVSHSSLTELKNKQGFSKVKLHKQNNLPGAVIWKSVERSASPGTSLCNFTMMSEMPIGSISL